MKALIYLRRRVEGLRSTALNDRNADKVGVCDAILSSIEDQLRRQHDWKQGWRAR